MPIAPMSNLDLIAVMLFIGAVSAVFGYIVGFFRGMTYFRDRYQALKQTYNAKKRRAF